MTSVVFLANFAASKGAAFAGPLLLAGLLPADAFGGIEFALAVAQVAVVVVGCGLPAAVPQLVLLRRPVPIVDLLAAHAAVSLSALFALAAFAFVLWPGPLAALAALATGVALLQMTLGSYWRSAAQRNLSTWIDNFGLLIATVIGLSCVHFGDVSNAHLIQAYAGVVLCAVVIGVALVHVGRAPDLGARARRAYTLGAPLILAGLISVWIVASGRMLVALVRPLPDVALFAFAARVALAVTLIQALIVTAFFVQIYRMRARRFDRLAAICYAGLGAACAGLMLPAGFFLPLIPTRAVAPGDMADLVAVFRILLVHTFAWCATGVLDVRLNQARLTGRANVANVAIAAAAGLSFLAASVTIGMSLTTAAWLVAGQMIAVMGVQLLVLWRRGLVLPKLASTLGLVSAVLIALAVWPVW